MTLERSLVGLDRPTTLRAVADTLRSALQCQLPGKDLPGYSQMAFYSIPASSCRHSPRPADAPAVGFVLFTDIERIDADSARRVGWGLASPGLTDVIRWFAGGGEHYRVLGFAATPCEIDVASSEVRAWTRSLARSVVLHGDSGIDSLFDLDPDQPAPRALRVEMLLYEFEMPFSLISETQPATHFEASGLRQSFDPASSCRRDHATRADR